MKEHMLSTKIRKNYFKNISRIIILLVPVLLIFLFSSCNFGSSTDMHEVAESSRKFAEDISGNIVKEEESEEEIPIEEQENEVSSIGKIAFVSGRDGTYQAEIYTMNTDGSDVVRLTFNESYANEPSWSPDGKRIAFTSYLIGEINNQIYVMDIDGSNIVVLASGRNSSTSWSPDGDKIVFESDIDGDYEIYIMDADGSNVVQLTDNSTLASGTTIADAMPSWSSELGKDNSTTEEVYLDSGDKDEEVGVAAIKAEDEAVPSAIEELPIPQGSIKIEDIIPFDGARSLKYQSNLSLEYLEEFYSKHMPEWDWEYLDETKSQEEDFSSYIGLGNNKGSGAMIAFEEEDGSVMINLVFVQNIE